MGDNLDDDFNELTGVNNYENYDDGSDDDDVSVENQEDDNENNENNENNEDDDDSDAESPDLVDGADKGKETSTNNLKKMKRKQKFQELKLKKKQKTSLEEEGTSSIHACNMSSEEQYQLCFHHCPTPLKHDLLLSSTNFLQIPTIQSNIKKNSFVHGIESLLPNYQSLFQSASSTHSSSSSSSSSSSPLIIIVCSSAIRATNIINSISKVFKCKIGKLFAKHFKIQDQITSLQQHFYPIVVGTPHRLFKLLELNALLLNETKLFLIDYEINLKSFSIFNLPEVCNDFYQLLSCRMMIEEMSHMRLSIIREESEEGGEGEKGKGGGEKGKGGKGQKKKKLPPKRVGFNKRKVTNKTKTTS